MAKIADVAELIMGQSPPSATYNEYGHGLPFFQGKTDFGFRHPIPRLFCNPPLKVANPGDILISVRAPVGPTNIADRDCCIGRGLGAIRPHGIDGEFLFYNLRYIEKFITSLGSGSTFQAINKNQLSSVEVNPNEFDLPEQHKVAGVLGVVQRAIEQQERLISLTTELKKALMQKLFTEGLRGEPQKQTEIGPVPESWEVVPLSLLAAIERGKFSHRPRNHPRFYGGTTPFVQTGDVSNCDGRIQSFTQTLNEEGVAISKIFPAGTILITIAANIGFTGILSFDSACPDSLIGLTPNSLTSAEFLQYYLSTQQPEMDRLAPRGTQKNINIQFLKPWPIPLSPKEEQTEIVRLLTAIDKKLRIGVQKNESLKSLFRNLLHQLMTAQLRVHDLDLDILECGDGSPLSYTGTRPSTKSADASAHSEKKSTVVPAHSKRGRR